MPQSCAGLTDPAGGPARPCIFAGNGRGDPQTICAKRDGPQCAFCSFEAFHRACSSPTGTGNIIRRLKRWHFLRSPTYEAAFTLGMPGLVLPLDVQLKLRRSAGEQPTLRRKISWIHRTKYRLETLLRGKIVPQAPLLSHDGRCFFKQCMKNIARCKVNKPVQILRQYVRRYTKLRQISHLQNSGPQVRREWWKLRRFLKQCFSSAQITFPAAVAWEGILVK